MSDTEIVQKRRMDRGLPCLARITIALLGGIEAINDPSYKAAFAAFENHGHSKLTFFIFVSRRAYNLCAMLQQWAFWHATYAEYDSDMTWRDRGRPKASEIRSMAAMVSAIVVL
ncbi:hypothetical protein [Rhizobium sp. CF142]|uniref:hypothetical protein n=1 Tax=Rhizobium sp. CF142 TaxID=1144314 RepID=UPI0012F68CD8|nr:hypothetical protein [Rhizobium sp. CF142]